MAAEFCGGCPAKGNCLEVMPDKLTMRRTVDTSVDPHGLVSRLDVAFVDTDGFSSTPIQILGPEEEILVSGRATSQVEASKAVAFQDAVKAVGSAVCERIARCHGTAIVSTHTAGQWILCPAMNYDVLQEFFENRINAQPAHEDELIQLVYG